MSVRRSFVHPIRWTHHVALGACGAFGVLALLAAPVRAQCPSWTPTFGAPGVAGTTFPNVAAQVWFDDGSGPSLFVGGEFYTAGDVATPNIARWDGSDWHALGAGLNSRVDALAVFDDGTGPALYAVGNFLSSGATPLEHIARWDGASWTSVGGGFAGNFGSYHFGLQVFDDGSGPALYAGGNFTSAGGVPAERVARWNGTSWSQVGAGLPYPPHGFAVFAPAGTPKLFAVTGGAYLYSWDGAAWGSDFIGSQTGFECLAAFDDGTGEALYAGGLFGGVDGVPALHVARWDGTQWSAVGQGLGPAVAGAWVYAFAIHDSGSGPQLYAGGGFTDSGGTPVSHVARWDGTAWTPVGAGVDGQVSSFSVHDDGSGEVLYVGGRFHHAASIPAEGIARFANAQWSRVSSSEGPGTPLESLLAFDDGSGSALYAGGPFESVGDVAASSVARWDGSAWSAVGGGVDSVSGVHDVRALVRHDDGSGAALYAGGVFDTAGGVPASNIARWDGTSWSALGSGIVGEVEALAVHDDGTGPKLYAGGLISQAGGVPVSGIARWDGTSWSALGSGITGRVLCLASFDDGGGRALFVGGSFSSAGGIGINDIARWRNGAWSTLGAGAGLLGMVDARAEAMLVHDDGTGPALYVGGSFGSANGVVTRSIARWNGTAFSSLAGGTNYLIASLATYDLGAGPVLVAGGSFADIGGVPSIGIAAWDGAGWSSIAGGLWFYSTVKALAAFDSGTGSALYAGGEIQTAGGLSAWNLAELHGCGAGVPGTDMCAPGVAGVMACPCGNPQVPPGDARGCNNSSFTGGARLTSSGQANLSADTVAFLATGERPSALSIFLQGDSSIPGGTVFGQGVRCVGGALKRLYVRNAVGGSVAAGHGVGLDLRVSERSAALGNTIVPGTFREYMVYYRDPVVLGGCPSTSTFNGTQGQRIVWAP